MASVGSPHQLLPAPNFLPPLAKDPLHPLRFDGRGPPPIEILPRHIAPDDKDAFISWLRAEFAAANAIIDALCYHLNAIGNPSEYDFVIACIHQRRYFWNTTLYMQHYFPVADVVSALHQVSLKRQFKSVNQTHPFVPQTGFYSMNDPRTSVNVLRTSANEQPVPVPRPDLSVPDVSAFAKNGSSSPQDNNASVPNLVRRYDDSDVPANLAKPAGDLVECMPSDPSVPHSEHRTETFLDSQKQGSKAPGSYNGKLLNNDFITLSKEEQDARKAMVKVSKHFQFWEQVEGKTMNVVEGLELYENVLNSAENSELARMIIDIQAAGRRGELGKSFIVGDGSVGGSKETIQFVHDVKRKSGEPIEPMPIIFTSIINRLVQWGLISASRSFDYCSIKVLEEGESIPLCMNHQNLDQYLCCLFLIAECNLVMGQKLSIENGDYKNQFKLSIPSGSIIVLQGNSNTLVRQVISASQTKRIVISFGKRLQNKVLEGNSAAVKPTQSNVSSLSGQATIVPVATWSPVGGGVPNMHGIIVPTLIKPYGITAAPGVLPMPPVRPFSQPPHQSHQQLPAVPVTLQPAGKSPGPGRSYAPVNQGRSPVARAPKHPNNGTGVFFPSVGSNTGGQPASSSQVQTGVIMVSSPSQKPELLVPATEEVKQPSRVSRSSPDQSGNHVDSTSSLNALSSNDSPQHRKAAKSKNGKDEQQRGVHSSKTSGGNT